MRTTKVQISLRIRAVWSEPSLFTAGSMICILALSKVSRLYLVSIAEQAGLSLTRLKISEDTFSRDVAQLRDNINSHNVSTRIFSQDIKFLIFLQSI